MVVETVMSEPVSSPFSLFNREIQGKSVVLGEFLRVDLKYVGLSMYLGPNSI